MFLLTQQRATIAQDVDEEDSQHAVGYDDDGLHEQLLRKLNQSGTKASAVTPPAAVRPQHQAQHKGQQAQHAAQHHWPLPRPLPRPLPVGLDPDSQTSPPSSRGARLGVHDLLDDLLTQAQTADATTAQQQHHPHAAGSAGQQGQPSSSSALQQWHVHQQQQQQQQRQQYYTQPEEQMQAEEPLQVEQQVPPSAAAVFRSNRQLLDNLLQPAQQQAAQQRPQAPPAASSQPPPAPAPAKQQQRKKSILYSTSSTRSYSTPLGRPSSTPQRAAAKKKPKFSIRDTPSQHTPSAFVTPQAKGQKAAGAAAAGAGNSGARSLAALLGSSAATPSRQQPAAADTSKTPVQHSTGAGLAGLFATPKHSSSKPPAQPNATAGQPGSQHTPGSAVVTAAAAAAGGAAVVDPAALCAEDQQDARTPAAAGADATTPQGTGSTGGSHRASKRKAADVNPLEVMTESRQRHRAFLDRLPAGPAAASAAAGLAGLQLAGVTVPLGANLSKIWQQLQDVRKKQQDRLEENPDSDAGALELEVHTKSWEAHLVKCSCTVIKCAPPPQQQQTQRQQTQRQQGAVGSSSSTQAAQQQQVQPQVGEKVVVLVSSKASHNVELRPGSRVKLHTPWHVMAPQQPGKPMVLLGYFMS